MSTQTSAKGDMLSAVGEVLRDLRREFKEDLDRVTRSIGAGSVGDKVQEEKLRQELINLGQVTKKLRGEVVRVEDVLGRSEAQHREDLDGALGKLHENLKAELKALQKESDLAKAGLHELGDRLQSTLDNVSKVADDFTSREGASQETFMVFAKHVDGMSRRLSDRVSKVEEDLEEKASKAAVDSLSGEVTSLVEYLNNKTVGRSDVQSLEKDFQGQLKKVATLEEVVSGLQARVEEQVAGLSKKIALALTEDNLAEIREGLNEEVKALREELVKSNTDIRDAVSRFEKYVHDEVHELSSVVISGYNSCEEWERGGAAYKAGALVRHAGGVWQALRSTSSEPGPFGSDSDWALVMNGIKVANLEGTDQPGQVKISLAFASGEVSETTFEMPRYNFLKTWEQGIGNKTFDVVTWKGCRWLALKDTEAEPGEDSGAWALHSMRGQRGPRGEKGERGDVGPPVSVARVLAELRNVENEREGLPIRQFRGKWQHGVKYSQGDVVTVSSGLRIANADNDGTVSPTTVGVESPWDILAEFNG